MIAAEVEVHKEISLLSKNLHKTINLVLKEETAPYIKVLTSNNNHLKEMELDLSMLHHQGANNTNPRDKMEIHQLNNNPHLNRVVLPLTRRVKVLLHHKMEVTIHNNHPQVVISLYKEVRWHLYLL